MSNAETKKSNVVGHLNPYPTDFMAPLNTVLNYYRDKSSVQTPELVHAGYEGLGVALGMAFPDNHVHAFKAEAAPASDAEKVKVLEAAIAQCEANTGGGKVMAGALNWKALLAIFLDLLKNLLSGS